MKTRAEITILIVDDDAGQRSLLEAFLSSQHLNVLVAESAPAALAILDREHVDLVISDVRMPKVSGLELLKQIHRTSPTLPVLLVTAFPYIKDAVEAMKDGAVNYLEKPVDLDELLQNLENTLGLSDSDERFELPGATLPPQVVAESPAMLRLLKETALVAPTQARVLVTGESGTGKEVIADLIHLWSKRSEKPLLKINCAAMQDTLLESELFGHEKGAFTGAVTQRQGLFEAADGGTLFLDEVGETSPALQAKLLRVIQDGTFQRLGSSQEIRVDVRVIAATNRHLEQAVAEGAFREDLFYRLSVIELYLPPLRERPEDLLLLANRFADEFTRTQARLSTATVTALMAYPWPGNIRELRNAMERAGLMARGNLVLPEHLPQRITGTAQTETAPSSNGGRIDNVERVLILQTLREHDYNRSRTAQALGISRRALIYKLQRYADLGYQISPVH
jgi:DNA-binding NtrC family response regulator